MGSRRGLGFRKQAWRSGVQEGGWGLEGGLGRGLGSRGSGEGWGFEGVRGIGRDLGGLRGDWGSWRVLGSKRGGGIV